MVEHSFFYATESADSYDELVSLTSESYALAHQIYRRTLSRVLQPLIDDRGGEYTILDLGCGTGNGVSEILKTFPSVGYVGFDISEQMIELARRKIRKRTGSAKNSVQFYRGDARNRGSLASAASLCGERHCIVMSAFMYHHMTAEEKLASYQAVFDLLPAGGFFLNLDLFDFAAPLVSELAFAEECDWTVSSFTKEKQRSHRTDLDDECAKWVHHITNENIPLPISAEVNSYDGVTETDLLHQAGFRSVSTPFRHFQTGIVLSIRGET